MANLRSPAQGRMLNPLRASTYRTRIPRQRPPYGRKDTSTHSSHSQRQAAKCLTPPTIRQHRCHVPRRTTAGATAIPHASVGSLPQLTLKPSITPTPTFDTVDTEPTFPWFFALGAIASCQRSSIASSSPSSGVTSSSTTTAVTPDAQFARHQASATSSDAAPKSSSPQKPL